MPGTLEATLSDKNPVAGVSTRTLPGHNYYQEVRVGHCGYEEDGQEGEASPYVPKLVTEINLAVQRVAVIWPVEEQVDSNNTDHVEAQLDGDNREQAQEGQADAET